MSEPYPPPAFDDAAPLADVHDDFKYLSNVALCELPVRLMFIRKVYALLLVQIVATIGVGVLLRTHAGLREWALGHVWLTFALLFVAFGFLIATHIKARSYPANVILLGCFTLCEAYAVGVVCAVVELDVVVRALALTLLVFVGLTAFSFQTKYDFTDWEGVLLMLLWGLIGFGLVLMFFPTHALETVYLGLGTLIFSVYIVVDTQKVIKTTNYDEEVVAALRLYLDILNLFMHILRLLQSRND